MKKKTGIKLLICMVLLVGVLVINVPTTLALPIQILENDNCGIFGSKLLGLMQEIYTTIELMMVVALIIFGIVDFIKATASDKDDAFKKAGVKFLKRAIVVAAIAILPIIIDFVFTTFWPDVASCVDTF